MVHSCGPRSIIALLAACAAAGCGASSETEPSSNSSPEGTAREALTTLAPSACERLTTDEFLAVTYPQFEREVALKYCHNEVSHSAEDAADKVTVLGEQAGETTATVQVRVHGGVAATQRLQFHLELLDGEWRISRIDGFEPPASLLRDAKAEVRTTSKDAGFPGSVIRCALPDASRTLALTRVDGLRGGRFDDSPATQATGECNDAYEAGEIEATR